MKLSELKPGQMFISVKSKYPFMVTDAKTSWIGVASATYCVNLDTGNLIPIKDTQEVEEYHAQS